MREFHVEDTVTEWAEANGFLSRKMTYAGRHGCRDRDFMGYGHLIPVEFKRPNGKPRPHQEKERLRFKEVGVKIHVIDSIDAGIALLKKAMAKPRPYNDLA